MASTETTTGAARTATLHFVIETATLTERLSKLKERAADMREPLDSFGDWFRAEMKGQFDSEGDLLGGSHWKQLTPAYAKEKQRKYGDKKILERTGDMMKSFTETEARGNVNRVSAHEGEWGSDIPYAKYHQYGTRKMVARPIISEHTDFLAPQLAKRIGSWLMGDEV